MKFGIQIEPQFGFEYNEVLDISKVCLKNGFQSLWFSDHFMLDSNSTDKTLLDPWLLMTALARDNKEIRIGSLVFCNSYRNPALHAKMASTLDVLSNGRLEFGIGAGWKRIEYEAYGFDYPDDMTRINQLAEAIQIIRKIWSEDRVTFHGRYYMIKELISYPKPIQSPHPTIWVGTMYGRKHMLEVAAKYGDGINLAWSFSPAKLSKIFTHLDSLRRTYHPSNNIKKSVGFWTRFFRSQKEMEEAIISEAKKRNIPLESYRERVSSSLWGTSDMIVDRLKEYEHLDVSHAILMFPHKDEIDQAKIFGKEVLPSL